MFLHVRRRRIGGSPSARVHCEHTGPGRYSLRPYLAHTYRRDGDNAVCKALVAPLAAGVRTCCLASDYRRRCHLWAQVVEGLERWDIRIDRPGSVPLGVQSLDDVERVLIMRRLESEVAYPSAFQWQQYARSAHHHGWFSGPAASAHEAEAMLRWSKADWGGGKVVV